MTGGNTLGEVKVLTRGGESRGRVSFPFPRCRRRQSAHEAARATWWLAGDCESLAATGTDGQRISQRFALHLPCATDGKVRIESVADVMTDSNAPTIMMGLSLQNSAHGVLGRLETGAVIEKAPPGFEPGMKVLQTSALPLGYGARKK
jgi:hypothetical protein